jgi:hypothetical protein
MIESLTGSPARIAAACCGAIGAGGTLLGVGLLGLLLLFMFAIGFFWVLFCGLSGFIRSPANTGLALASWDSDFPGEPLDGASFCKE